MLKVTRSEKQIEVHVAAERRPLIYLDQCALYDVCKHNAVCDRFKEFFKTRGELLLSSINMFELGQLQGDSLARAKAFLDETIGLAWIPIEFDCTLVIVRELEGKFSPSPAICERLLEDVSASTSEPTISKLLDGARHSDQDKATFIYAKGELVRDFVRLVIGDRLTGFLESRLQHLVYDLTHPISPDDHLAAVFLRSDN